MQMPSAQFMPGMTFAAANQPQARLTAEQYALAQQMAMQNMMHQMYLQYMNYYANFIQSSQNGNRAAPPMSWPHYMSSVQPAGPQQVQNNQHMDVREREADAELQPRDPPQPLLNDDEAENRDWLEIVYTFSRLIVLLSLVYFYSSPGRCSVVIFVMVLYYL